jgi:hypothetical protein
MRKSELVTAVESIHYMVDKERILEIIDDNYPTIIEFSNDQKNNILFLVGEEERDINTDIEEDEPYSDQMVDDLINNAGAIE